MGCDIHLQVEARNGEGEWRNVRNPFPLPEWLADIYEEQDRGPDHYWFASWPDHRDYDLFTRLAGVRYIAGRGITPGQAVGLPTDLAPETRDGDLGDHSYSWLPADEFVARVREVCGTDETTGRWGPSWPTIATMIEMLASEAEVRCVFGFDS